MQNIPIESVKDSAGKPNTMLLLTRADEQIIKIREYGLTKYPNADNWKGIHVDTWVAAAIRHLFKYVRGEYEDEESGESHLSHALCNLAYAVERIEMEKENDT